MRYLYFLLVAVLLLSSFSLYTILVERQPIGWDALGYKVAGRNIAHGKGPAIVHPLNGSFGPYFTLSAFAVQRDQEPVRLYLNYPPGFPLLLAIAPGLGVPDYMMLPLLSMLGVFFTYLLGTLVLDRWVGLLGAAILALMPAYVEWGTAFWADLPGTCLMLGAMVAYLTVWRQERFVYQVLFAGAAGLMAAWATGIKYSNVLILLPLFLYAFVTQRRAMLRAGANWIFLAVLIAGFLGIAGYNHVVLGRPWETHYSASRSGYYFSYFSLSYALGPSPADGYSLIGAAETLWANFSWLLLLVPLGVVRGTRKALLLLGGMFLPFLALASTFAWSPVGVDTRYLLPTFAPLALFVAQGCLSVVSRRWAWDRWALGLLITIISVTLVLSLGRTFPRLVERNRQSLEIRRTAMDLTADSDSSAVFMAYLWNDPVNYFGERTTLFYRRMDLTGQASFENELVGTVRRLLQDDVPIYYIVDSQPPFANSLGILEQNFDLDLWKEKPLTVYRVAVKR